mmetsp:Transcript_29152/g.56011  ORF Transcript_29152/g.56011 Transcript_29152/m.56011 type:complete len:519 (+) Transcript_29152:156-1712(+)
MMRIPPHLMRRTMLRGGVWGIPVTTSTGFAAMQQSLSMIENTINCLDDYGGTYRHRWSASAAHPVRMFSSVPIDKQMQASEEGSSPDGMDARQFLIKLYTADTRGAGTPCEVEIALVGDLGASSYLPIGEHFESGSVREVTVVSDKTIGKLRGVRVRKRGETTSEPCNGWFLEKVEVAYVRTGAVAMTLHTHAWLGKVGENTSLECRSALERRDNRGPCEREFTLPEALPVPRNAAPNRPETPCLSVHYSAAALPHPSKVKDGARSVLRREVGHGGEDAYFNIQQNGVYVMGVADGVYMWRTMGIDAGEFSRALMAESLNAVRGGQTLAPDVLSEAGTRVTAADVKGSSTVCIIAVDTHTRVLTSANLGDSGFMLIRGADMFSPEVVYMSEAQEHEFGRPFQLGHHDAADAPADAIRWTGQVKEGDIIVAGSDGLFDNLEVDTVVEQAKEMVHKYKSKGSSFVAKKISARITECAFNTSLNRGLVTPYSRAASEAFDMVYSGGKKDDICVAVAIMDRA